MNPVRLTFNLLLPPRCAGCKTVTQRDGVLCPSCWISLDRLGPHICGCCGVPFAVAVPEGTLCGKCLADPPAFEQARSVFAYTGTGRDLVLALKHGDGIHLAPMIGSWMVPLVRQIAPAPPVLIPVPLHWSRLWRRQYNQSRILADVISRSLDNSVVMNDLVIRYRATKPQGSPGALKRSENVRNAFRLHQPERIARKFVVLVDDVMTSGSTVHEIARLLKKHDVKNIGVVTAARTGQA